MGKLIIATLEILFLLIKTFPKVAVPTLLLATGALYFDFITFGEVALAFAVFMVLLIFCGLISGLISRIRSKEFARESVLNALMLVYIISLFLSGFFISEIRSMPTAEQRIALAQEQRENEFLRNYSPSKAINHITSKAEMTDYGKRLFFLNDPQLITTQSELNSICKTNASHIDVSTLGCFSQRDKTIYLLDNESGLAKHLITATAAHELLHSVYVNLSFETKQQVDEALVNIWNGPDHEYLKKRLSAYSFTADSPNLNELHSIIGTELGNLPPALEEHYSKYFNQGKVYNISKTYNNKVEVKKIALAKTTKSLNILKKQIQMNKKHISQLIAELNSYKDRMNHYKSLSNSSQHFATQYNELVPIYNNTLSKIKDLENETQSIIIEYNSAIPKINNNVQELKLLGSAEET